MKYIVLKQEKDFIQKLSDFLMIFYILQTSYEMICHNQQIYLMKIILLGVIFISLILQVSADNKYTQSARYKLGNNCDKIAFSDDEEIVIMYSSTDFNAFYYRSYDMKQTATEKLDIIPLYLETFTNNAQGNAMLYAVDGGIIYLRNFTYQGQTAPVLLKTIQNCSLSKVSPSPDKTLFAASCQDSSQLIIGNLLQMQDKIQRVDVNVPIKAFRWHPSQNKVLITGFNETTNAFQLKQYDCNSKKQLDLSDKIITGDKIQDVEYSPDDSSIAYIRYDSTHPENIIIIHPTKNATVLYAPEATQLFQLKRKGKLLTAYDQVNSYVWVFDNEYYGSYNSILKSPALSTTGGQIYTIDPLSKEIIVSRFCPMDQVFKNDALACAVCQSPCQSCFFEQTKCSSCQDSFYFDEKTYSCKACIENCKTCDANACKTCLNGFYLNGNTCDSCAKTFLGCLTCTSKGCKKCDDSKNWQLNTTNQCQCKIGFTQIGQECVKCPLNCALCQTADECQVCDIYKHRQPFPVDGQCVCNQKYFQDPFSKQCQSCVLGCNECDNKITCKTCDKYNNWVLVQDSKVCACLSNYIQINNTCKACYLLIDGCRQCLQADQCKTCMDGYDLNETLHCNKHPEDGGVGIVVIIIVGICVLIGLGAGSYFIMKVMKKRRGQKVQTLLESQAENQQEEMG